MKKYFGYIWVGLLFFFGISCEYESEEKVFTEETCDTTRVISFSADVQPILKKNKCLLCHISSSASGGVVLNSHEEVQKVAVSGRLSGAINHESGFSPMPPNVEKIAPCDIAKIEKWITEGMPNN